MATGEPSNGALLGDLNFHYKDDWGDGLYVEVNGIFKLIGAAEQAAYWRGTGSVTLVQLVDGVPTKSVSDQPNITIVIYYDNPPS